MNFYSTIRECFDLKNDMNDFKYIDSYIFSLQGIILLLSKEKFTLEFLEFFLLNYFSSF